MKSVVAICFLSSVVSLHAADTEVSRLVEQATFSVTNLIDVSMDEAKNILEAQSKSEWKAVEERMKTRLEEVKKELKKQQKSIHFGTIQSVAADSRDLERTLKKELRRIRKTYQARLEELQKLKVAKYGESACSNLISATTSLLPAAVSDGVHD